MKFKITPTLFGATAALSPVPLMLISSSMGLLLHWLVYAISGSLTVASWFTCLATVPLIISPVLGILGTVYAITVIKRKGAWKGLLLSLFSLIENAALWCILLYIGQF